MGRTLTFPNGQTLTSTALTASFFSQIMQVLTCQMLGLNVLNAVETSIISGSNSLTVLSAANLQVGWQISDANPLLNLVGGLIPLGTTITALTPTVITMSNKATGNASNVNVFGTDPAANTAVRIAWNTEGAPAWTIGQDVVSIECITEDDNYNRIRDNWNTPNTGDPSSVVQNYEYTRAWRVHFTARGPNSFDNLRIIKSALLLDFTHDSLALNNVYLVPELVEPVRSPEYFESQWWEVTSWHCKFYEQVNETISVGRIETAEVIVMNQKGIVLDITI